MIMRKKQFLQISFVIVVTLITSTSLTNTSAEILGEKETSSALSYITPSWYWLSTSVISELSDDSSFSQKVEVDDNNNIHIIWNDDHDDYGGSGIDRDVFYVRWDAEDNTWSNIETVSTDGTGGSDNSDLAVEGDGTVHVTWRDNSDILSSGIDYDVLYKRRNTVGVWTSVELVSTGSTGNVKDMAIVVDSDGNPIISWADSTDVGDAGGADYDIFFNKLLRATDTWTGMTIVSEGSTLQSQDCDIEVDSKDDFHIVWQDSYGYLGSLVDDDIIYRMYDISEDSWSPFRVISSESTADSETPTLSISNDDLFHIAWTDLTDYLGSGSDYDIFYKYYDPHISTWTLTEVISTESTSGAAYADIVVDDRGFVHLVWEDLTDYAGIGSDWDIIYEYKNSDTNTWSSFAVVSSDVTDSSYLPEMAVDSQGFIHFAWYDASDIDGAGVDYDILYKKYVGPPEETFLLPINSISGDTGNYSISWAESYGATEYKIYNSTSYIWNINSLAPLEIVEGTSTEIVIAEEGTYYFAIIASNDYGDSELSNIESVELILEEEQSLFNFANMNWGEIVVVAGIVSAIQIILTITLVVTLKSSSAKPKKGKK